jgi:hypothetical protein
MLKKAMNPEERRQNCPMPLTFLQWEASIVALAVFAAGGALCLKR